VAHVRAPRCRGRDNLGSDACRPLVGERKAARMARHVRMNGDGEGGQLAVFLQGKVR
jgi:hypothetical protein